MSFKKFFKKFWTLNIFFIFYIIFKFFENFQILWNLLTYWWKCAAIAWYFYWDPQVSLKIGEVCNMIVYQDLLHDMMKYGLTIYIPTNSIDQKFINVIIWNIDMHTCLLDSTFLCPHLLNNNKVWPAWIISILIGQIR